MKRLGVYAGHGAGLGGIGPGGTVVGGVLAGILGGILGGIVAIATAGTAAAVPDVVGATYDDAEAAISDAGGTAVVASRVGNQLAAADCIVTHAWEASFVRDAGDEFVADNGEVMVALNCNASHASATGAGASLQSPAGRESKAAEDAQARQEALAQQEAGSAAE